ncbi:hypothetical protein IEO21_00956 [Rhodonia placenta]|uniref:Uncharacterized protein n=1 Tax=Rhodonia placenta TaxID=104341 RepID=A0A8H7PAG6_9APHY|nr:hypothetical protein IEO21_00956 [Postia placenta]
MSTGSDKDHLIRLLEAHGQQFLGSFKTSSIVKGKRKASETETVRQKKQKVEDESEDEWSGFGNPAEDDEAESEESNDADFDDDFSSNQVSATQPNVVVFSERASQPGSSTQKMNKAQMKAFMSSKVTKLTQEVTDSPLDEENDDEAKELSNAQNDALLHRLVHTRILSGSLDPDLNLTSAQRKKALAGRVLEAAGKVKLGKGEGSVRAAERNKAAKRVREGMMVKQKERQQKELEEAKQLGNYHPTLKKLYDASSQASNHKPKRERGLKMGVGSFRGGVLKLSQAEISTVEGSTSRGRGKPRGRGRGGSRGRGRGRGGKR